MEDNEIMTMEDEVLEESTDTAEEEENSGGMGLGAIAIGGLAAYGLYHAVKGGVKLGKRGLRWAKDKVAARKDRNRTEDETEDPALNETEDE